MELKESSVHGGSRQNPIHFPEVFNFSKVAISIHYVLSNHVAIYQDSKVGIMTPATFLDIKIFDTCRR